MPLIMGARFIMTDSSTLGLLDAAADSLAGRIDIISLPSACWGENHGLPTHTILNDSVDLIQIKEANRDLDNAMTFGQFPEVLLQKGCEEKYQVLVNYRNTYFTRDLMLR